MKIFLVRMYLDSGWVNFYNQTTKEKIIKYIKKRGCEKLTIRLEGEKEYKEFTVKEFLE